MSHDEITFLFFLRDRRDDQELFTGDFISKIIVPHPALNFPKNLTVTYQVYRGWLTRGLSSWSINKVVLSDSFGESYSLCKPMKLESGKPHRMTLQPGDCHEEELALLAAKAIQDAIAKINKSMTTSAPQTSTELYPTFNATSDVIELGKHIPLERNETESASTSTTEKPVAMTTSSPAAVTAGSNASWVPILTANKRDSPTNPAVTANTTEIDEASLNFGERMPKKAKTEKRSFGESSEDDLMNSVPIRDDSSAVEEPIAEDDDVIPLSDDEIDNKFVTVQLFQYRLGDVFEKAEKYARNTLFPLLSEQISNIFNFEGVDKESTELSTDTPVIVRPAKSQRKYDTEPDLDYKSLQTIMGLQVNDYIKPIEKMFNNYQSRVMGAEAQALKQEESKMEVVRISLPTYRPEVIKNEKKFIPIERDLS